MLLLKSDDYMGRNPSIYTINRTPQNDFPEHGHDFSEFVLVCNGSGIHVKNDTQKVILPQMVTLVTDKDYHLYESTNELQLFNVCYKKNAINLREESANVLKKIESNMSDILVTEKSFEQVMNTVMIMENEQKTDGEHTEIIISVLFEQLLFQIDRLSVYAQTSNNVTGAIVYICENYKNHELSVAHVCEKFEVTAAVLNSKIFCLTGTSTNKFINALRINKAKKLLSEGRTVTEVAFLVGFNDSNYFSTKFKSVTGYTPRAIRVD